MNLILRREPSANGWTAGNLFVDDEWECFTCEDVIREVPGSPVAEWKIKGETAIPSGTYQVVRDYSNRFRKTTLHVLDVPGFEGIRIHAGCYACDTEGCLLPGKTRNTNGVFQSRLALEALESKVFRALERGEPVQITITTP